MINTKRTMLERTWNLSVLAARAAVLSFVGLLWLTSAPAVSADDLTAPYARQVQQMYVAYYGRPGDPGGVDYWAGRLAEAGGNWIADLVNAFGNSAEYRERFGSLSDETLIDNLYRQLFNRSSDPVGLGFYVDLLNGSNLSGLNPSLRQSALAQIALDIANGAQNQDLVFLQNKIEVAGYFTGLIAETGQRYQSVDIDVAAEIIAIVTSDPVSVSKGKAAVDVFIAAGEQEPVAELLAVHLDRAGEANRYDLFSGETLVTGPARAELSDGRRLEIGYRLVQGPPGLAMDETTGALRYEPLGQVDPGSLPFEITVTHGVSSIDVAGSIELIAAQTRDTAVADGFSPVTLGNVVSIDGGALPAGTEVALQTGWTAAGERRVTLELPAELAEGSSVRFRLGELEATALRRAPVGATAELAADGNEGCTDFAPYKWPHKWTDGRWVDEERWFFLGLYRHINSITEDLAEAELEIDIPWYVVNPIITASVEAGLEVGQEISFVKRRASVLCSDYRLGDEKLRSGAEPVLFVHGYTPMNSLGGGPGTYAQLDEGLSNQMPDGIEILPFEFRWRTNARYEDVAVDFANAVDRIEQETGKDVHIVAHSFGGLLARTYLQDLADTPSDHWPAVASLTTVGTPHSGIFSFESDQHPQGTDVGILGQFAIQNCGQISCVQAGQALTSLSKIGIQEYVEWILGTTVTGELIRRLASAENAFLISDLPVQVLIGLRGRYDYYWDWPLDWPDILPELRSQLVFSDGDGLISFDGQRILPGDRKLQPLRESESAQGATVSEYVIGVKRTDPDFVDDVVVDFPGFGHTDQHTPPDLGVGIRALKEEVKVENEDHEVLPYLVNWIVENATGPISRVIGQLADETWVTAGQELAGQITQTLYIPSLSAFHTIVYNGGNRETMYPGCAGIIINDSVDWANCRLSGSLQAGITYVQRLPVIDHLPMTHVTLGTFETGDSLGSYDYSISSLPGDLDPVDANCKAKDRPGVTFYFAPWACSGPPQNLDNGMLKMYYANFRPTGVDAGRCDNGITCRMYVEAW